MNDIDLRPLFAAVKDQGQRGTCIAFAVTAAHELVRYHTIGTLEDLAEETLYWKCKQVDGDQFEGTSFDSAIIALKQVGQPHEEKWPYDGFLDDTNAAYSPPADAVDPANCFTTSMDTIAAAVDDIHRCLTNQQAVILGIEVCDSFLMSPGGRVAMPKMGEPFTGGHAVLVVGYQEDASHQRWLIFRNSWGDGWGDNGYGYLPCEYLELYGGEAAIIHV